MSSSRHGDWVKVNEERPWIGRLDRAFPYVHRGDGCWLVRIWNLDDKLVKAPQPLVEGISALEALALQASFEENQPEELPSS